jgi:N-acyl-D-aspartate/D-glutamate deacylase
MAKSRWKGSDKARIELRRMWVARFSAIGMKLYEITEKLAEIPILNPDTGEPYDVSTISRDITEIESRWRADIAAEVGEHKARQLAELREARRKAWAQNDVGEVRLSIATEMKLLGTESPDRHEFSGTVNSEVTHNIDGDTAETIFDILASIGAIKPALDDAEDDEIHTARTD